MPAFPWVLCYEYLSALPFLLPPLIIYGIKSEISLLYWAYTAIVFFLTPLVPLGLATIPTVILMRFANLSRHKDLFRILGGMAVIVLAVGAQFFFQGSNPNNIDPTFLNNLLSDRSGFMNLVSRLFPTTRYLGLALINAGNGSGVVNLIISIGYSLLTVALAWLVGEKFYFKGLVGSSETSARRQKLSSADYLRLTKIKPAIIAYWQKEMRILLRTPTYFMNSIMISLLFPVFLLVPFIISTHKQEISIPWGQIVASPQSQTILIAVLIGIILFMTSSNAIAATAISREGKQLFISKYIPLSYQKQIQAKLLSAYVFSLIGAVLVIAAARIIIPLSPLLIAILLVVSLTVIALIIETGLLIDLLNPKLQWENEQQALKHNFNVLYSMLPSILIGGIIIFIVIRFIHSPLSAATFMFLCFGLLALLLYYLLMTWGIERYHKLEG